ncbi:MAG TPA: PQQ-binding-like beta-propeller repeat protein [Ktedonobacterales bacterium]|nr:PQQ-binding-like beta-propeller repeat protein [Ktedonobacterales bacterium]
MRGSSRWVILIAALALALAGCGGTTSAVRRQPTPVAGQPTATGTRAAATATRAPASPSNNVYYLAQNPTSLDDGTVIALNVSDGSVRWKFDAKRAVPPVAGVGVVYVTALGGLYALDGATGAVRWHCACGGVPVAEDGVVYAAIDGHLAALDSATGRVSWEQTMFGRLTVTPDTVYVRVTPITRTGAAVSSTLYALDPATGTIRWSFARTGEGFNPPFTADDAVYFDSHLTVSDTNSPAQSRLYALDGATGALRWSVSTSLENDDGVTVANGLVYLKAVDAIFAFHSADGTPAWKRPETLMGRYTVAGDTIYLNTFRSQVEAINALTGALRWTAPLDAGYVPITDSGRIYYTTRSGLIALDTTGKRLWGMNTATTEGFPTLAGKAIYDFDIQPTDPTNPANNPTPYIYAVDAATGAVLWKQAAGSDVVELLVVDATA